MKRHFQRLSLESWCVLVVAFLAGSCAIWVVPPIAGFDGPCHYFRSLEIAQGHVRSRQLSQDGWGRDLPNRDVEFVNTLWSSYWSHKDFQGLRGWARVSAEKAHLTGTSPAEFTNTAVYSPANYVPQVAGFVAARVVGASPLVAYHWATGLTLITYIALVVAAIELLPAARSAVALLATTPLILMQAASLSADGMNFALPCVLLAAVWRLRALPLIGSGRVPLGLFVTAVAIAGLKPPLLPVIGCLLFVPPRHFRSQLRWATWLVGTWTACLAVWWWWNHPYFGVDIARWFYHERPSVTVQRAFAQEDPGAFGRIVGRYVAGQLVPQWSWLFTGVGAWTPLHHFTVLQRLAWLGLGAALLSEHGPQRRDVPWSVGMFVLGVLLFLAIAGALWLTFGLPGEAELRPGVLSGRYLYLVFAAWLMAIVVWTPDGWIRTRRTVFFVGLAANATAVVILLLPVAQRALEN